MKHYQIDKLKFVTLSNGKVGFYSTLLRSVVQQKDRLDLGPRCTLAIPVQTAQANATA